MGHWLQTLAPGGAASVAVNSTHSQRLMASHYRRGIGLLAQGDNAGAYGAFCDALAAEPGNVEASISQGIALLALGDVAASEACQRDVLGRSPGNFFALVNLGTALHAQGRFAEAIEVLQKAVLVFSGSADAFTNLGRVLIEINGFADAARAFHQAHALAPASFDAATGLGVCLVQLGLFEAALPALENAHRLRPGHSDIRLTLANVELSLRNYERARPHYEAVLQGNPASARATAGLAAALAARGEFTKPNSLFRGAIALDSRDHVIRGLYAAFLLRYGDYERAWDFYDYRWEGELAQRSLEGKVSQPRWRGEDLAGKTLLILCEQGLGDEIMFASLFPDIIARAGHCVIECDDRLAGVFSRSFPGSTFFPINRKEGDVDWFKALERNLERLPAFDYWTAAGSLPRYFRRTASAFPRHRGYLNADPTLARKWRARVDALGDGAKIGISWRGGGPRTNRSGRSLPLQQLGPLLTATGVHLVSLQYGDCEAEREALATTDGIRIQHWQDAIEDYDETAALVASLTCVISVCTAVVHLAGALGKPVWVLAPYVAEWRYGADGDGMIWYPGVRVFRQPEPGAWAPVLDEVRRSLTRLLDEVPAS